jgi:hypothetical protein
VAEEEKTGEDLLFVFLNWKAPPKRSFLHHTSIKIYPIGNIKRLKKTAVLFFFPFFW